MLKFAAICAVLATSSISAASGKALEVERRITNGTQATRGQFPYQAYIHTISDTDLIFFCGGALVRYNWVLTAVHCATDLPHVSVYLGSINMVGMEPSQYAWSSGEIPTHHRYTHPEYSSEGSKNNIAMLYLETASEGILNIPYIGVIALPTRSDAEVSLVGKEATVTGYGVTSDNGDDLDVLHYMVLPIVENSVCAAVYPNAASDSTICTSPHAGMSPCNGDYGSPLTIDTDWPVLAGIVSIISESGCSTAPTVYEKVSYHLDWIETVFSNQTITTETPTPTPSATPEATTPETTPSTTAGSSHATFNLAILIGLLVIATY